MDFIAAMLTGMGEEMARDREAQAARAREQAQRADEQAKKTDEPSKKADEQAAILSRCYRATFRL